MLGHFYVRVAKGFLWVLAILTAAAFMAFDKPYFFGHGLYIVPPLLVCVASNLGHNTDGAGDRHALLNANRHYR